MEKVKIAIVEDSEKASDGLLGNLNRYERERGESFEVTRFYDALSFTGGGIAIVSI